MFTSKELPRVRHRRCLAPDLLEQRMVLSSGQGSTFAIMPGSIDSAGKVSSVPFTMDPSLFTAPKDGKLTIGIDVTPATASTTTSGTASPITLRPEVVSVVSSTGQKIKVEHTHYYPKIAKANHLGHMDTSAALVTLKVPANGAAPVSYSVQIKGLNHTTGKYLLGFYLPGDANGDGTVNSTDITTIKSLKGDAATNSNYNFDADVNRDGIINGKDVRLARQNLGATTLVSPVVSVNLDPASDPSLNRTTTFSTVHFAGKLTPGATITFANNQNNGATTSATADSTGAYTIMVPLVSGSNTFTVTTHDGFGQSISGNISPVVYDPNPSPTSTSTSSSSGSTS
jgi:Dockerin type I domain